MGLGWGKLYVMIERRPCFFTVKIASQLFLRLAVKIAVKIVTAFCFWTVLGSYRRSDRKSAWKLIGSDQRPDAVIIHSETTQLVTIICSG